MAEFGKITGAGAIAAQRAGTCEYWNGETACSKTAGHEVDIHALPQGRWHRFPSPYDGRWQEFDHETGILRRRGGGIWRWMHGIRRRGALLCGDERADLQYWIFGAEVDDVSALRVTCPTCRVALGLLPDVDAEELYDEDLTDHAMRHNVAPHEDGRSCSWHSRLGVRAFRVSDGSWWACLRKHSDAEPVVPEPGTCGSCGLKLAGGPGRRCSDRAAHTDGPAWVPPSRGIAEASVPPKPADLRAEVMGFVRPVIDPVTDAPYRVDQLDWLHAHIGLGPEWMDSKRREEAVLIEQAWDHEVIDLLDVTEGMPAGLETELRHLEDAEGWPEDALFFDEVRKGDVCKFLSPRHSGACEVLSTEKLDPAVDSRAQVLAAGAHTRRPTGMLSLSYATIEEAHADAAGYDCGWEAGEAVRAELQSRVAVLERVVIGTAPDRCGAVGPSLSMLDQPAGPCVLAPHDVTTAPWHADAAGCEWRELLPPPEVTMRAEHRHTLLVDGELPKRPASFVPSYPAWVAPFVQWVEADGFRDLDFNGADVPPALHRLLRRAFSPTLRVARVWLDERSDILELAQSLGDKYLHPGVDTTPLQDAIRGALEGLVAKHQRMLADLPDRGDLEPTPPRMVAGIRGAVSEVADPARARMAAEGIPEGLTEDELASKLAMRDKASALAGRHGLSWCGNTDPHAAHDGCEGWRAAHAESELADFDPESGHRHGCAAIEQRDIVCDCTSQLFALLEDAEAVVSVARKFVTAVAGTEVGDVGPALRALEQTIAAYDGREPAPLTLVPHPPLTPNDHGVGTPHRG